MHRSTIGAANARTLKTDIMEDEPSSNPAGVSARFVDRWKTARGFFRYVMRSIACPPLVIFLMAACAGALVLSARCEEILIKGATVHTISGDTLSPGQVLIRNGKIVEVGQAVAAPGAVALDLQGQQLYPGLIALDTVLGLTEIESVRGTADSAEVGEFTPDVESWIAVNPDSELLPVARANGVAYFEPVPAAGIVSGQSGLLAVDGWTTEGMILKKPIALHLFWPDMDLDVSEKPGGKEKTKPLEEQLKERREKVRAITDFFAEAKAYAKALDAGKRGLTPAPQRVPAWEAMLPYVQGELPLMIHADEIRQIKSAVTWASTNNYRAILVGGRDAWMVATMLAEKKIPVIYPHTFTMPPRDTASYDVQFTAPAALHQAGVTVAFGLGLGGFDAPGARNLPYAAAQAVAFGLPESEALKSLTLIPSQLAGLADRIGSIEPGKEATLVATDGNILDIRANVKHMWIAGREISLETRHTRLYERYKNRPRNGSR